jgi:2-methylaconitate cis-trans-isomerase PrpF
MQITKVPIVMMRGGTSKAVFVKERFVPKEDEQMREFLRSLFGSPDPRQIDGLGGADILTSKCAIIGPSTISGADVDYTFAQIGIEESDVNFSINCGNISPAVGVYAIEEGFVRAEEPFTNVRIHNTNTGKILIATIPVKDGQPEVFGDYSIDGVPHTGAEIEMDYRLTAGAATGSLLPTGNPTDYIQVPGLGEIPVSIVDLANLCVFFEARYVGMQGTEGPREMSKETMMKFREIRKVVATMLGLGPHALVPFTIAVAPPSSYQSFMNGQLVDQNEIDLVGRMVGSSSLMLHKAFPGTGSCCTAVAAAIKGTIVHEVSSQAAIDREVLRIGHPSGRIAIKVKVSQTQNEISIDKVAFSRTARRLMEGTAYVRTKASSS